MPDKSVFGKIIKDSKVFGKINKGVGMGELPQASGLSEFLSPAYSVNGTDLTAVQSAISEKSGVASPAFPDGFVSAVEGWPTLYQTPFGALYTPVINMGHRIEVPNYSLCPPFLYRNADKLIEATITWTSVRGGQNADPVTDSSIKRLFMPYLETTTTYIAARCTSLEEAVLGSVGNAVSALSGYTFRSCTQTGLTITVYVNDGATLPLTNSPWGATNATIVYRSATTGEVIEV